MKTIALWCWFYFLINTFILVVLAMVGYELSVGAVLTGYVVGLPIVFVLGVFSRISRWYQVNDIVVKSHYSADSDLDADDCIDDK